MQLQELAAQALNRRQLALGLPADLYPVHSGLFVRECDEAEVEHMFTALQKRSP